MRNLNARRRCCAGSLPATDPEGMPTAIADSDGSDFAGRWSVPARAAKAQAGVCGGGGGATGHLRPRRVRQLGGRLRASAREAPEQALAPAVSTGGANLIQGLGIDTKLRSGRSPGRGRFRRKQVRQLLTREFGFFLRGHVRGKYFRDEDQENDQRRCAPARRECA